MLYRLWLTSTGGDPITFVGFKEVRDDPGFDLWRDTTTLYVQLLAGQVDERDTPDTSGLLAPDDPRIVGAGVLRIAPLDFARQLTTFAAGGPDGGAALARFGQLFLGELWHTYAPLAGAGR